jgi:GxxExxY protein
MEIVYKDEAYEIIGACFDVYTEMGCGFLESVYQECLEIELTCKGISFCAQPDLELRYRDRILKQKYKPDFIVYGKIVIELKAASGLSDEHRAQLHNYLKATGYKLGLLVNFGQYPKLQYERIVR